MPVCGTVEADIWNKRFEYGAEELTPYYYKTSFEDYNNSIEFTPQARSGYFKLTFVENSQHFIRMGIFGGAGEINVEGKRVITGIEEFAGMKAYFYAEVDTDISEIKYKNSDDKKKLLMHYLNVSFSHKNASLEIREKLTYSNLIWMNTKTVSR